MDAEATSPSDGVQPGPGTWRQRLAKARGKLYWANTTRELVNRMTTMPVLEQRSELKNYINWIDVTLALRTDIDPTLLVQFAEQFARLAKVLGASGDPGMIVGLDQAIELVSSVGKSTTTLYLAKAACCGSLMNEHSERSGALEEAIRSTEQGSARWADAMLALSQYYTDVSKYDRALAVIAELREKLASDLLATRYECGASVYEGYAKMASMRDLAGGERDLERALTFESGANQHAETAMWVSMAYYRKGRLAQMRRDYLGAVPNYLKAKELREKWWRDPRTFGFIHLRIAESLTASGHLDEAEQHLGMSKSLFKACSDRGSGWLQCCIAQAVLDIAMGRPEAAIETLEKTLLEAREIGFHRGELLCLGRLAVLHARRREVRSTIGVVFGVIRTGLGGELGRNGTGRLLRGLPVLVKTLSTRKIEQGRKA
jgi:tetratricopeptide (TPR) repeat protein